MRDTEYKGDVIAVSLARTTAPIPLREVSLDELRREIRPCTCVYCRNPDMSPQEILVRDLGAQVPEDQVLQNNMPDADAHNRESDKRPLGTDVP
jgi:hypothetical protein